jgi:hypothetical protein
MPKAYWTIGDTQIALQGEKNTLVFFESNPAAPKISNHDSFAKNTM